MFLTYKYGLETAVKVIMHTRDSDAMPLKKSKEREREKRQSAQVSIKISYYTHANL